jgi:hypothetical protein
MFCRLNYQSECPQQDKDICKNGYPCINQVKRKPITGCGDCSPAMIEYCKKYNYNDCKFRK